MLNFFYIRGKLKRLDRELRHDIYVDALRFFDPAEKIVLLSEARADECQVNEFLDIRLPLSKDGIDFSHACLSCVAKYRADFDLLTEEDVVVTQYKHPLNTPWNQWRGGIKVLDKASGTYVFSDCHRSYHSNLSEALGLLSSIVGGS